MDTDELSREAYQAVLIEAEMFDHNLTLHFGMLSYECDYEEEYLRKSINLIEEIKTFDEEDIVDFFFNEPFDVRRLNQTLEKILSNIAKVREIPVSERRFDRFL